MTFSESLPSLPNPILLGFLYRQPTKLDRILKGRVHILSRNENLVRDTIRLQTPDSVLRSIIYTPHFHFLYRLLDSRRRTHWFHHGLAFLLAVTVFYVFHPRSSNSAGVSDSTISSKSFDLPLINRLSFLSSHFSCPPCPRSTPLLAPPAPRLTVGKKQHRTAIRNHR